MKKTISNFPGLKKIKLIHTTYELVQILRFSCNVFLKLSSSLLWFFLLSHYSLDLLVLCIFREHVPKFSPLLFINPISTLFLTHLNQWIVSTFWTCSRWSDSFHSNFHLYLKLLQSGFCTMLMRLFYEITDSV